MPESKPGESQPVQEVPPAAASDPVPAKTILVFGDAAIDWYEEKRDFPIRNVEAQALPSPELPRGWIWHETAGGCLLLDRMIHRLLGKAHKVVSPVSLRGDIERTKLPREIYGHGDAKPMNNSGYLHSLALIDSFKSKRNPDEAQWRVSKFLGFNIAAGPAEQKPAVQPLTYPDAQANETEHADVLVIDDAGWSFRHNEVDDGGRPVWPRLLAAGADPPGRDRTLVLKISSAVKSSTGEESPLWQRIKAVRHRFNDVVIVVNAVDLRRSGLDISHRLSWDRTVQDLAQASLTANGSLFEFTRIGHVLVRFDFDGAVIVPYRPGGQQTPGASAPPVSIDPAVRLLCDPWAIEGDFFRAIRSGFKGGDTSNLSGGATAFVAGLVGALVQPAKDEFCITDPERRLLDASSKSLVTAVSRALATARTLYERGLGRVSKGNTDAPAFDLAAVLAAPQAAYRKSTIARFKAFDVPAIEVSSRSPLITSVGTANELAFEFARRGESVLERLPVLRYGDFTTADPQEIENYRAIANLIETQLATGAPKWRLSRGVFGPPGAGKSFGVKSIARSLVGDSIRVIDANVAQFSSPRDLTREFHSARDETLRGKIPLLFFDEFDTAFQTSPRGWLRFFLAPMQDGMFFDDAREHAIERAIFVFAGGTAKDLSDFYNPDEIETDEEARQQKVPDFVSRLHGVINVRGPDPRPDKTTDPLYALRRATLIRAKLFDYGPNLFEGGNKKGALRIADTVLRALLNVPKYHHGARSIDAIIRMSGITPAVEHFEQAMLPSRDQLRLHVNAEKFEEELRR